MLDTKIDQQLFRRQRAALVQAIEDSPHPLRTELLEGLLELVDSIGNAAKYHVTYCSQCGEEFGPGDHGYSHCEDHE